MRRIGWLIVVAAVLGTLAAGAPAGDSRGYGGTYPTYAPEGRHDAARDYIQNQMTSYGLAASLESFTWNYYGITYGGAANVVGVKVGAVHPEQVYIIGCHYDSVQNPGADDNASGAAGILEAARVLSQYEFQATIELVAFDLEEKGLFGSQRYVQDHPGQQIMGMISLDMIAFNPAGAAHDTALIYGADASGPAKQALAAAVSTFGGLTPQVLGPLNASDHAPFEAAGYQAALLIEGAVWSNPNYHTPGDSVDTPDYIDYEYAADMTRSAVGWVATEAVLTPEPATMLLLAAGAVGLFIRRRFHVPQPARRGGACLPSRD